MMMMILIITLIITLKNYSTGCINPIIIFDNKNKGSKNSKSSPGVGLHTEHHARVIFRKCNSIFYF